MILDNKWLNNVQLSALFVVFKVCPHYYFSTNSLLLLNMLPFYSVRFGPVICCWTIFEFGCQLIGGGYHCCKFEGIVSLYHIVRGRSLCTKHLGSLFCEDSFLLWNVTS